MGTNPKFWQLLGDIQKATLAGKVQWHEGFDDDSYRLTKPYGLLEVARQGGPASHEDVTYLAELMDDRGQIAESATAKYGPGDSGAPESFHFMLLETLFKAAQESAHPSGGVLDQMLADFSPQVRG